MKKPGQIVLLRFPHTDLEPGKLRPVLLLAKLPGEYDDWLVCMISSRVERHLPGFDELVGTGDPDFERSGLKVASVIRIGRLAVVGEEVLVGAIGEVSPERLRRIKQRLADWLTQE